jgi:hypothetical protein
MRRRPRGERNGRPARTPRHLNPWRRLVNALVQNDANEPAAANAWTISTGLLVEAAWAAIFYGLFMVIAALLAGSSQPAVAIRRAIAPYASRPAVAYTALAAFVVLLLWWRRRPRRANRPWR